MWYFAWILGTLLACAFGVITARRLSTLKRPKRVKKTLMKIIATLYAVMDKRPLRALSLVMALLLAGCIFWDPSRFAAKTSERDLARFSHYVGGVRRCDPRRRLSSESDSLAGHFLPAYCRYRAACWIDFLLLLNKKCPLTIWAYPSP